MIWTAVLLGSMGTFIAKAIGFALPSSVLDRPLVRAIAGFLPISLLAALVAVQTVSTGTTLTIDGRAAGLVVAVIALILRAPFLVVVFAAAATAALLRATGLAA